MALFLTGTLSILAMRFDEFKQTQKETYGTSSRKRFDNKFDSFAESEQPLSRVDFFAYPIV